MDENRIRATYLVETRHSLEHAADQVAAIVGAGTFTAVPGETEELKRRFAVEVESIEPLETLSRASLPSWTTARRLLDTLHLRALVTVAIPLEITGVDLTTLLATVAGGVFGLRELSGVRLVDLDTGGESEVMIKEGYRVTIYPNCAHRFEAEEDAQVIEYYDSVYEPEDDIPYSEF